MAGGVSSVEHRLLRKRPRALLGTQWQCGVADQDRGSEPACLRLTPSFLHPFLCDLGKSLNLSVPVFIFGKWGQE